MNLENRVAIREAIMEKVIKQRLKNLCIFLSKKEGTFYDYRDIAVKFTRNLPTDLVGLADVIVKLKGVCSQETLLLFCHSLRILKLNFKSIGQNKNHLKFKGKA